MKAGTHPPGRAPPARLINPTHRLRIRTKEHVSDRLEVCPIDELPPGSMRLVEADGLEIGVFNCAGTLYAIEDRCSHDDGELLYGILDEEQCTVECPRHGSLFDLKTGKPMTLPAYEPVETFPVSVDDGVVTLEVD